jgi:hypothetical protein
MTILRRIRDAKPSRFLIGTLLVLMVIMIPIMATLDTNSGNNRTARVFSTPINPIDPPPRNFNGLFIWANITNIDLNNHVFKATFNLQPMGSLAVNGNDPVFKRPNTTINVGFGSRLVTFPALAPMTAQKFDIPIDFGNVNRYPFDSVTTDFILFANSGGTAAQASNNIEVAFAIVGAIQSWRTDIRVVPQFITGSQFIEVTISSVRSFTVQFFSLVRLC